ncbi:MAG: gamma-glutamyltransferase [Desulfarculus sp.]|jgi:gamma-glutamyltranspeptidase/glutathione hydrolase|nr:MAG: gamma-glutamyltransferase [Desulfarculus sp.]
MHFNYQQKREWGAAAQRSVLMAPRGMCVASQPLATHSGLKMLQRGGNAVDAAVAMVATLSVVEPYSVGIGGDCFALFHLAAQNKVLGLNSSGRAPKAARQEWFAAQGLSAMPTQGMLPVTTPGALMGWAQAVERHGRLGLADVFEDAIYYARHGFPVTEVIAGEWREAEKLLAATPSAAATYLLNGRPPRPGQVFQNPDLAAAYAQIVDQGIGVFYGGALGQRIAKFSQENGGLLALEDLAAHQADWVEPIGLDYRGWQVLELPPNGQGLTALEILNILAGYDLAGLEHNSPEHLHLLTEAIKLAFADRDYYLTDPTFYDVPVARLLSAEYGDNCRRRVDPARAMPPPSPGLGPRGTDTVYVAAGDQEGNSASFISSVYMAFGSGMVVPGTGIALQNRGHSFSLDPAHPNCIAPNKRTRHTIIPGMLMQDGRFVMSFGVMGGDMQPQGHAQFISNLVDFGLNLQEAVDAPRLRRMQGKVIYLEEGVPEHTGRRLAQMGHELDPTLTPVNKVGGGQAVYRDQAQGVWLGASDRRKDGCALGF